MVLLQEPGADDALRRWAAPLWWRGFPSPRRLRRPESGDDTGSSDVLLNTGWGASHRAGKTLW